MEIQIKVVLIAFAVKNEASENKIKNKKKLDDIKKYLDL